MAIDKILLVGFVIACLHYYWIKDQMGKILNWLINLIVPAPQPKPKLEDGEVVYCEDGIYYRCPVCDQLTPQLVEVPDWNKLEDGQHPMEMKAEPGNLQPLIDLRGCITGMIDIKTGKSKIHKQCKTCGQALRDKNGNALFIE